MPSEQRPIDSLHADSFLFSLRAKLDQASAEEKEHAYAGAAAWTSFVFSALRDAASDCGMVSCDARRVPEGGPKREWWVKREYLFDVTWFRSDCTDWEPPSLILEHENQWSLQELLIDFWKLLFGFAPLRIMIGYAGREDARTSWIEKVNGIIADEQRVRLPEGVDDVILLGHKGMQPTGYAVYRRHGRHFDRTEDSLAQVSMPDPRDARAWDLYIRQSQGAASERVHRDVRRLEQANILDHHGRVISTEMPRDMDPTSATSVITG